MVSAWRVRRNIAGKDQWSLLDKRDPMKGQHYYPIQDPSMTLVYGDQLAFRCTMVNLGKQSLNFFTQQKYPSSYFEAMSFVLVGLLENLPLAIQINNESSREKLYSRE